MRMRLVRLHARAIRRSGRLCRPVRLLALMGAMRRALRSPLALPVTAAMAWLGDGGEGGCSHNQCGHSCSHVLLVHSDPFRG